MYQILLNIEYGATTTKYYSCTLPIRLYVVINIVNSYYSYYGTYKRWFISSFRTLAITRKCKYIPMNQRHNIIVLCAN